jgi:hypothetical protein
MELKPFIAKTVSPGEPVTAQGWNDLVEALDLIYKFVASARHVLKVTVSTDAPPDSVRVTAEATSGVAYQAVAPVGTGTHWIIAGLEPGDYTLRAEAPGYVTDTKSVTLGDAAETTASASLTAASTFMPELFGKTLEDARSELQTRGITLARLWDCLGAELVPANPGEKHQDAPVFVQWPPPGRPVTPATSVALVVAGREQQELVEVPSLIGMTAAEVHKTFEQLGLVIGTTETKK